MSTQLRAAQSDTVISASKLPRHDEYDLLLDQSNELSDTKESLVLLQQVFRRANQSQDSLYMVKAITGSLYYLNVQGQFDSAIHLAHIGLEISLRFSLPRSELQLVAELASIYYSIGNYQQALDYGHKSLVLAKKHGFSADAANILNNLGEYHFVLEAYDSATYYYHSAMQAAQDLGGGQLYAYASGGIGMVYGRLHQADSADKYFATAVDSLSQLQDWYAVGYFLQEQAQTALDTEQPAKAEEYLQRTLRLAQQHELRTLERDVHQKLATLYQQLVKPDYALRHYQQYISMRDSLDNARSRKALAETRASYEISLAQAETDKVQALNDGLRARTLAALFGLLLFAFLSLSIWLYWRQRRRRERQAGQQRIDGLLKTQERESLEAMVKGQDQERKRIAQELHDHLGSLLATVKVNLQALPKTHADAHQTIAGLVDQACHDVRNLSHSLHMGLQEQFGLAPALEALAQSVAKQGKLVVQAHCSLQPEALDATQEIMLYRIIQELLSNALKHARASNISINITGYEAMVNLMIEDDGRGFQPKRAITAKGGIGLRGIKERVAQLEGEFSIDSRPGHGTVINIDLPIASDNQI